MSTQKTARGAPEDNGYTPDPYSEAAERTRSSIDATAKMLQEQLDDVRRQRAGVRVLLAEVDADEQRLSAAIVALTGRQKPGPKPGAKRERDNKATGGTSIGRVTLQSVLDYLRAAPQPVGNKELADALGITVHTANAATNTLRKQELVRRAGGLGGPGGGFTYAAMPGSERPKTSTYVPSAKTQQTREQIIAFAREHESFIADDLTTVGVSTRGLGPTMRALLDAGLLTEVGTERSRQNSALIKRYKLGEST